MAYTDKQILWDRSDGLKFKTPSKKIELRSSLLEEAGFSSFPAYEPIQPPVAGQFRLITGRNAVHTHVSTQNNPYLNELMPENMLWINASRASQLGIKNGDLVMVSSQQGSGQIKAFVTEHIHPEAVFMVHGFGHEAKLASRAYNRGVSDALLQEITAAVPVSRTGRLPVVDLGAGLAPAQRRDLDDALRALGYVE